MVCWKTPLVKDFARLFFMMNSTSVPFPLNLGCYPLYLTNIGGTSWHIACRKYQHMLLLTWFCSD